MSGRGCQLLVSPCGVSPSLGMIREHQPPSLGARLSPSSGMDKVQRPFASGKQSGSHVALPTLSLRRQVLTSGKQPPAPTASAGPRAAASLPPGSAAAVRAGLGPSSNSYKGCLASEPTMEVCGHPAAADLAAPRGPAGAVPLQPYPPSNPNGVPAPPAEARSLLSRESLASTTLSLFDTQSVFSGRHEWPYGYRVLPPLSLPQGCTQASEGGDRLVASPGTAMSGTTSTSASLPSYLFASDAGSPRPSRAKKRALSMSPLSDVMGIDFNSIIRTSPTSLVAYINGSRCSPASHSTLSPVQSEGYGHFLGIRGRCIGQVYPYNMPGSSQILGSQMPEEGGGLETQMANMVVEQQSLPGKGGAPDKTSGSCNPTTSNLPPPLHPHPTLPTTAQGPVTPQGPPPPYHSHQHIHLFRRPPAPHGLTQAPAGPPRHGVSSLPQVPMLEEEEGELEDYDAHCCRWSDCSAVYDHKEELVRHIEKLHVDQRKAEDFVCYWVGCPRRFKPFNARYKLLIHMRVHSGEKPNKCTFEGCKKAFSRLENLKIHLRSHTGEKPYLCQHPGCHKAFSNSSDRAKHQRTHLDTKPYACQVPGCAKRYTDPSSLRKHVKSHSTKERHLRKKMKPSADVAPDPLTDCLTIHPLQPSLSSLARMDSVNPSPGASPAPQGRDAPSDPHLALLCSIPDNYRFVDPSPHQLFSGDQYGPCSPTCLPHPPTGTSLQNNRDLKQPHRPPDLADPKPGQMKMLYSSTQYGGMTARTSSSQLLPVDAFGGSFSPPVNNPSGGATSQTALSCITGFELHSRAQEVAPNQQLHGGDFFPAMDHCTNQVSSIYTDG
ncbi:zinc finger protein GLIS3 isoform X2 [Betta splendens]|uniref:Zinc finger protein GLIS3 isoform X2 n=1 Tax=Betta splendens TaxID=158456 RepID=A0A6P7P1V8_BETSP|nr:zinc finger protein GLIS3 isoform X2 [Betta splendens]